MSDNIFSAEDFMNETIDEAMDTRFETVPEGEYLAQLADEQQDMHRHGTSQKGDPYRGLRLTWVVLDDNLKQKLGRDTITVRQDFLLDIDQNGKVLTGPGKNVRLGALREALGLNQGPFSWDMLPGAGPARIRVRHRPDKNDPEIKYAEVSRVTKA